MISFKQFITENSHHCDKNICPSCGCVSTCRCSAPKTNITSNLCYTCKGKELTEAKQVGILYHYTSLENLIKITKTNMLRPFEYDGISFTRDKHFHKVNRSADSDSVEKECRIVLDGNKLSHRYKIRPYNYFGTVDYNPSKDIKLYYKHIPPMDEQEELIREPIRNLNPYVIKIQIFKVAIEEAYDNGWFEDGVYIEVPTPEDLISFLSQHYKVELI